MRWKGLLLRGCDLLLLLGLRVIEAAASVGVTLHEAGAVPGSEGLEVADAGERGHPVVAVVRPRGARSGVRGGAAVRGPPHTVDVCF